VVFDLDLTIGVGKTFALEESNSQYVIPGLHVYFSDILAKTYQPILYSGNEFYDHNNPSVQPEGIYYRIVFNASKDEYCIQYYVYWLNQNCTGFLNISNHKYDYEPIYIFFRPPYVFPVGIINSGESKVLGPNQCRFHKTEIRRKEYDVRDQFEASCAFKTSKAPYYPFGGSGGLEGRNCAKRYPIAGSIYFSEERPLFGIATCFHAFSGAESMLRGQQINLSLKRLNDDILLDWYKNHYKESSEEPFGHDVSNPFEFPHVKYVDPKPFLE
jgi:hypothetical protein